MPTRPRMSVRWRLRQILDARAARGDGLSLNELSRRAAVSYPAVHAIAQGTSKRVDLETLDRLCRVLGVRVGDLLEHEDDAPATP